MHPKARLLIALWAGLVLWPHFVTAAPTADDFSRPLKDAWFVQSSSKVTASGAEVSQPGFEVKGWYPASVPTTVLAALVRNGVYKDIYFADRLKSVPEEPFRVSWWYRTEFLLPADPTRSRVSLELDGVNYRADVWLNGRKVGGASEVFGAFRRFRFDVTDAAKPGQKNALAIEVFPPQPGEPTIGFVDWNPKPPDRNLGLWRGVRVRTTGAVSIHDPNVMARLDMATLKEAQLTITAELRNNTSRAVSGVLEARVDNLVLSQSLSIEPGALAKAVFTPASHPQLSLKNPRVWWTHDLGRQEMYDLAVEFKVRGRTSDKSSLRFGVRDVSDSLDERGVRSYRLNGKPVLIRGGGWTDDLLLDNPYPWVRAQVEYAREMNLNALRVEGFWGTSQDFYDLCDEIGILVLAGWSCQWEWENYIGKPTDETYGGILGPEDIALVARYWRDQVRWLRHHPSILVWLLASDLLPKPELEQEYRKIMVEDDPTRPLLVSAASRTSSLSGVSGVKMNGPYDYVPPVYWYADTSRGGAFGFNTETGPGPQVPPLEALKKMIPEKDLWPVNDLWFFHCCRGEFDNLDRYNEALAQRLGPAKDLREYLLKAQFLNYEAMRAMFEAFVANRYKATGIIQWMYNSAWPKLWWQLFDYSLLPTAAFFGARKACEPLHLLYRYDSGEVVASNLGLQPTGTLRARIRLLNNDGREMLSHTTVLTLGPDATKPLIKLAPLDGLSPTYFLDLRLETEPGVLITDNFYVLSTAPDVLDEEKTEWYVTPIKAFADLKGLNGLPTVELKTWHRLVAREGGAELTAELENPGPSPAVLIELMVVQKATAAPAVPIFWEDNYFTLLPGEKRTVRASFPLNGLPADQWRLKVSGLNVRSDEDRP